jgi:hypothetical protein
MNISDGVNISYPKIAFIF